MYPFLSQVIVWNVELFGPGKCCPFWASSCGKYVPFWAWEISSFVSLGDIILFEPGKHHPLWDSSYWVCWLMLAFLFEPSFLSKQGSWAGQQRIWLSNDQLPFSGVSHTLPLLLTNHLFPFQKVVVLAYKCWLTFLTNPSYFIWSVGGKYMMGSAAVTRLSLAWLGSAPACPVLDKLSWAKLLLMAWASWSDPHWRFPFKGKLHWCGVSSGHCQSVYFFSLPICLFIRTSFPSCYSYAIFQCQSEVLCWQGFPHPLWYNWSLDGVCIYAGLLCILWSVLFIFLVPLHLHLAFLLRLLCSMQLGHHFVKSLPCLSSMQTTCKRPSAADIHTILSMCDDFFHTQWCAALAMVAHLHICPFAHLPICPITRLPIHPFIYLPVCLYILPLAPAHQVLVDVRMQQSTSIPTRPLLHAILLIEL